MNQITEEDILLVAVAASKASVLGQLQERVANALIKAMERGTALNDALATANKANAGSADHNAGNASPEDILVVGAAGEFMEAEVGFLHELLQFVEASAKSASDIAAALAVTSDAGVDWVIPK